MQRGFRAVCVFGAFLLTACGGLDRADASRLIREEYFGPDDGPTLSFRVRPGAIAACSQHMIGWTEPDDDLCLAPLAHVGVVTACGFGEMEGAAAAPSAWAIPTTPSIVNVEPADCGASYSDLLQEGRDRFPDDAARRETLDFVATFSEEAMDAAACEEFIARSRAATASDPRGHPRTFMRARLPGARRFGEVTGIADGADGVKNVDFTWTTDPQRIPRITLGGCALETGEPPTAAPQTSHATFRHYDDGWRIDSVAWGD